MAAGAAAGSTRARRQRCCWSSTQGRRATTCATHTSSTTRQHLPAARPCMPRPGKGWPLCLQLHAPPCLFAPPLLARHCCISDVCTPSPSLHGSSSREGNGSPETCVMPCASQRSKARAHASHRTGPERPRGPGVNGRHAGSAHACAHAAHGGVRERACMGVPKQLCARSRGRLLQWHTAYCRMFLTNVCQARGIGCQHHRTVKLLGETAFLILGYLRPVCLWHCPLCQPLTRDYALDMQRCTR